MNDTTEKKDKIIIESDLFMDLRAAFNRVLDRTLHNMKSKDSDTAEVTIKLNVKFKDEYQDGDESVVTPEFSHKVTSISKFKDEESGRDSGEYAIIFDDETGVPILRRINDNQISIDDELQDELKEDESLMIGAKEYPALESSDMKEENEPDESDVIDIDYQDVED